MEEIKDIDDEIKKLKTKKKIIEKKKKIEEGNKKLRLRSNSNGKCNVLTRVSRNFVNMLDLINKKRIENGFDKLSNPKLTELIVKHKFHWKPIQDDLIRFDTEGEKYGK